MSTTTPTPTAEATPTPTAEATPPATTMPLPIRELLAGSRSKLLLSTPMSSSVFMTSSLA